MTTSALTPVRQTIAVDEVVDVQVSEIEDRGDGTFIRAIRVYGQPDGRNGDPVFELRLIGNAADDIEITTPTLNF